MSYSGHDGCYYKSVWRPVILGIIMKKKGHDIHDQSRRNSKQASLKSRLPHFPAPIQSIVSFSFSTRLCRFCPLVSCLLQPRCLLSSDPRLYCYSSGIFDKNLYYFPRLLPSILFKQKKLNRLFGFISGVLTLFPFLQWQRSHSIHHATSSNLDKRGTGDIWMMTVKEYNEASAWTKVRYRLYRNPFIMFILGPIYVFLIKTVSM